MHILNVYFVTSVGGTTVEFELQRFCAAQHIQYFPFLNQPVVYILSNCLASASLSSNLSYLQAYRQHISPIFNLSQQ